MFLSRHKTQLPTPEQALPGRDHRGFDPSSPTTALNGGAARPPFDPDRHTVLDNPLLGPYPSGLQIADFGLGCFWGAERRFWQVSGVWTTLVGYQGGHTPNPTYEEVCSGRTGHTEAVRVVFDPALVSYEKLLKLFWESHDPTQGFRQGNDTGTQYRSAIYTHSEEQQRQAESSRDAYQPVLTRAGYGPITTEILPAGPFYAAEGYHQQYLDKNPAGYCGIGGTGQSCPVGVEKADG